MSDPVEPNIRVSFYNFFHAGGIGRYTHDLLRAMAKNDDLDVELMCTPQFHWRDIEGVSVWPGLTPITHPVSVLRRMRFLYANWSSPKLALKKAKDFNADIIHFAEFNHLTYSFWQKELKNSGMKVAISVHDVFRDKVIFNRSWEDSNLANLYREADALFVHSRYQGKELQEFCGADPEKIHIVPHGPYEYGPIIQDTQKLRREQNIPESASLGLFFGQFRDEKNLDGLLRAMAQTKDPVHLIAAGMAGGRHKGLNYYQSLVAELGLEDRVHFRYEYVPAEEVGKLFSVADWVALPYVASFSSQSGVLNIAAHYRKPILVSEAPVLRETVVGSDIGLAADDNNPAALANSIDELTGKIKEGHPFAFKKYQEEHSWAENARVTIGVYHRLMENTTDKKAKTAASGIIP